MYSTWAGMQEQATQACLRHVISPRVKPKSPSFRLCKTLLLLSTAKSSRPALLPVVLLAGDVWLGQISGSRFAPASFKEVKKLLLILEPITPARWNSAHVPVDASLQQSGGYLIYKHILGTSRKFLYRGAVPATSADSFKYPAEIRALLIWDTTKNSCSSSSAIVTCAQQ